MLLQNMLLLGVSMLNFKGLKCFLKLCMNKDLIKQVLISGGSCFFWGLGVGGVAVVIDA